MSIVCHGKLPTGQPGDLEAGPGDLTGLDKLLCYGYHRIQNRKNTTTNITKTLILKSQTCLVFTNRKRKTCKNKTLKPVINSYEIQSWVGSSKTEDFLGTTHSPLRNRPRQPLHTPLDTRLITAQFYTASTTMFAKKKGSCVSFSLDYILSPSGFSFIISHSQTH